MAEQVDRDSAEGQYQESITDIGSFIGTRRAHETVQTFSPVDKCVNVSSVSLSPPRDIAKALENWLEKTLLSPGNLSQLAALTEEKVGVVTDDDLRIRELTKEERAPVVGWLELSSELMMVNRIREVGTSSITVDVLTDFSRLGDCLITECQDNPAIINRSTEACTRCR